MKKIILLSALCLSMSAMAADGYLTDSSGRVVRSGTGLCWHTSSYNANTSYLEECDGPRAKAPVAAVVPAAPVVATAPTTPNVVAPARASVKTVVLFAFDSSAISSAERAKLDAIITPEGTYDLSLVGYADPIGAANYNMRLSQRRADAVVAYMKSKGARVENISVSAKGESDVVVQCDQRILSARIDCNAPNRRVEINSK